ncbi:hypothetical protein GY45DRAFT_982293 [Cubamyces sp. BRFM 1775]|nr:hypothetical protein GY45DRAFT_982293 [Cubamyces sp. BRFM 1775]
MRSDKLARTVQRGKERRRRGLGSRPGAQACAHRSSGEVVPTSRTCGAPALVTLRLAGQRGLASAGFGPHPSASSYVHAGLRIRRLSPSPSSAHASASRPRTSSIGIWRASNRIRQFDIIIDVLSCRLSSPSPSRHHHPSQSAHTTVHPVPSVRPPYTSKPSLPSRGELHLPFAVLARRLTLQIVTDACARSASFSTGRPRPGRRDLRYSQSVPVGCLGPCRPPPSPRLLASLHARVTGAYFLPGKAQSPLQPPRSASNSAFNTAALRLRAVSPQRNSTPSRQRQGLHQLSERTEQDAQGRLRWQAPEEDGYGCDDVVPGG